MSHKKIPFVLAVASMALLASCGTPSADPTPSNSSESKEEDTSATAPIESESSTTVTDEEFDPSKPVTINFWHTMGKTPGQEVLNSMIARFNEIYPNITVEHSQQGGYDEIHSTINENLATGNLPTMAYCYEDHVASYIDHNAVLDMTPYVEDPVYGLGHNPAGYDLGDLGVEDMTPSSWVPGAAYAVEGRYSFPFSKSTEALFYNKSIFDANGWEAPKTWDEMWDICEQIRSMPAYANNDDFYCLGYDSDANLLIGGFEQRGLPYTSLELNASGSHFNFNTAENKAFVAELKSHHDNHYLITQGSSSNNGYTSELFKATTCLMSIGSTGGTSHNHTDNFKVGVAGVPQEDVNDPKMISQGPSICFFKRGTTKAQRTAAWLFYKFITNTENSAYYASRSGYNPVRDSSYSSVFLTDEMENATGSGALIRDVFHYIGDANNGYLTGQFTSPAFKGSSVARLEMDGLLASVFLGTKNVDKAFNDAMANCVFAE